MITDKQFEVLLYLERHQSNGVIKADLHRERIGRYGGKGHQYYYRAVDGLIGRGFIRRMERGRGVFGTFGEKLELTERGHAVIMGVK